MSFGVVQSAITSIRNNLNQLSKRNGSNTLSVSKKKKYETKAETLSSYELKKLKHRILQENRAIKRKQILFVAIILSVIIAVLLYFM